MITDIYKVVFSNKDEQYFTDYVEARNEQEAIEIWNYYKEEGTYLVSCKYFSEGSNW